LIWPALKACEPHVVLLGLSALAVAAVLAPPLWLALWRGAVVGMAALAPLLALGRAARSVRRGEAENEFGRWFREDRSADEG
jgi:hypothetical protein